ncbi:MAG: EAL domain-containing protein [Gemmatimonadetes bacterium]|nr:EAL domain-containing protein [Gemmatimonadota bacterium]
MQELLQHPASFPVACGLLGAMLFVWRSYLLVGEGRRALELKRQEHESLFARHVDAVIAVDTSGTVERANAAVTELTGLRAVDLVGRPFMDLIAKPVRMKTAQALKTALDGRQNTIETEVPQPMGEIAEIELTSVPIVVNREVVGTFEILRDATERKKLERELENRALHDYLTRLPNRALFADRLKHALRRRRRDGDYVALLYVDLDRFKPINDRAGHAVGDEILREVSARLRTVVRDADTVARIGGDEFAVLLETVDSETQAITAAERIVALVRSPVTVDGEEHQVGASVGIAVSSPSTEDPEQLVHQADLAMYDAKRRGGFQYRLYSHELEQVGSDWSHRLETQLRRAVDRNELELEYQPIVESENCRIVGVEALVRWTHPEHGPLLPASFIPIAEESSLITELDRWVLDHGCREVRRLVEFGLVDEEFFLSANLSARHFEEPDFVNTVSDILLRTSFDPARLQLEITESSAGGDTDKVKRLKELGVKVAIDDFGTGFSSLSYLRDLDVDVLKVDKSFVFSLGADPASVAIVRTILTLAEMLNLEVIVEGIEDEKQLAQLEDLGGSLVQGYLFGRPVPGGALAGIISSGTIEPGSVPDPAPHGGLSLVDPPGGVPDPPRKWVSGA